jgi:hypothetical protein
MLLSAKLGLVLAQFMWKQQPQFLQVMPFVTHLRQASHLPGRLPVILRYIYANTVTIFPLYYGLIYLNCQSTRRTLSLDGTHKHAVAVAA